MDPVSGTFTSMDTYAGSLSDPMCLHKYLFANSNPVMYSDPSGNRALSLEDTLTAIAIITIIASSIVYSIVKNSSSKGSLTTNSFSNSTYYRDIKNLSDIEFFNDVRKGLLSVLINATKNYINDKTSGKKNGQVDLGLSGSGGVINPNNNHRKTKHGRYKSKTRGFDDALIDEIRENPSQKVYQSEGRVVYAKKIHNYYYVVVENSEGEIITTVGGKTRSLRTWADVVRMLNNQGGYSTIPWR